MNIAAVILAAGQGTRMKSTLPKVLHRVVGRTLIGHIVENTRAAGADALVVVVGHGREAVEAELRAQHGGNDLGFALQAEQRGTGHAVLMAAQALRDRTGLTLVLPGDVPNLSAATLRAFIEFAAVNPHPVAVLTARVSDPTGYGRIIREAGRVTANVEHRDASEAQRQINEINSGVYLFDNAFLWENLPRLGTQNSQGEYYLPDLIAMAQPLGGAIAWVAADPTEIEGINTRAQLAAAEDAARRRRNHALMLSGVTLIDPRSTWIDIDATIEPDVAIEPGVRVTGRTTIGSGTRVGVGCVIDDSTIAPGVTLKPYCHIESARIHEGAVVGPFAHLRPEADIGPAAHVGNFCEVEKSTLGPGSKVNHLSYIGDATIGASCNIGAGTITCNYDGVRKNRTVLGDRVFTGSNSALVAPITLADDAFVAAGSVVTDDVEAGALAVGRGRQHNIPGWVAKYRASFKDGG